MEVSIFEGTVQVGVDQFLPSFVSDKANLNIMKSITKGKLHEVLHSFQKAKSPSLYAWLVEFFLSFLGILEEDLLRVVEESRDYRKVLASSNLTFIAFILKKDNPISFEEFCLI